MSDDQVHRFVARCAWRGSTGAGYRAYSRAHRGKCLPARLTLPLSADPAFRGDPARLNPEQLLVLAASSCQLLSFLAEAARARLDVVSYDDEAEGFMPEGARPQRLIEIWLRPRITVFGDEEVGEVQALVERAHSLCYVANSLHTEIHVEAEVRLVPKEAAAAPAYAFGDSDAAACRLALVARVFESSSRAFLARACPPRPVLAVDVGCGPGHSTRVLGEVSGARQVIGLDASPAHQIGRAHV